MHIEKKHCYSTLSAFTATSHATAVAHQHASLFPTRMALARWTRGGDTPHVHASEQNMPMRSTWYAQAQQHFQAWLDAGGFHRADEDMECVLHDAGMTPAGIDGGPVHDERATASCQACGSASRSASDRSR